MDLGFIKKPSPSSWFRKWVAYCDDPEAQFYPMTQKKRTDTGAALPCFFISNLPGLVLYNNTFRPYSSICGNRQVFEPRYIRRHVFFLGLIISLFRMLKKVSRRRLKMIWGLKGSEVKKSSFQSADKSLSKYRIYLLCEDLDERSP